MANRALSLDELARVALVAALDLGFNAAEVERFSSRESLFFSFGDRAQMNLTRLRVPSEWAIAYSEGVACTREPRQMELPSIVRYWSSHALQSQITGALLELAP